MKVWMNLILVLLVVTFMVSQSPLMSVVLILKITFMLTIWITMMSHISIISFVMFLIFLGGLMIMFVYMCSIAPNEKLFFSTKSMFLITLMVTSFFMISKTLGLTSPISNNLKVLMKLIFFNNEKIYVIMFIYLLFALFVCVVLCKKKEGSIRSKNI